MAISRPDKSEQEKLQEISLTIKDIVPNADRVSLWLFNKDYDAIECLICIDQQGEYSSAQILRRENFEEYFDFILKSHVLRASQARVHPATSCFNHGYFDVYDIHSLLDYVFHEDFTPVGVICCEKNFLPIEWADEDVDALRRVSNVVSMFLNSTEVSRLLPSSSQPGVK